MMSAVYKTGAAVMETEDSDDEGEPRLEIVDEQDPAPELATLPTPALASARALKKSVSLDVGPSFRPGAAAPTSSASLSVRHLRPLSMSQAEESNASEAIESLLLLGQGPVLSPRQGNEVGGRRYSSGPESSSSVSVTLLPSSSAHTSNDPAAKSGTGTYYQRMRERNNEASKRCRLKRRLKAESMENQSNLLFMSNKLLKQRIGRLEKVSEIMKEAVKYIQTRACRCNDMVESIKKANAECHDVAGLTNKALIDNSRQHREQYHGDVGVSNGGALATTSSEDEISTAPPSSSSPPPPMPPAIVKATVVTQNQFVVSSSTPPVVAFPGNRTELSVTPISNLIRQRSLSGCPALPATTQLIKAEPTTPVLEADQSIPITVMQQLRRQLPDPPLRTVVQPPAPVSVAPAASTAPKPKTALDVINDTIIKSLTSPLSPPPHTKAENPSPPSAIPVPAPILCGSGAPAPLNLVKILPTATLAAKPIPQMQQQQPALPPSPIVLPRSPSFTLSTPPPPRNATPQKVIFLSSQPPPPPPPVGGIRKQSTASSVGEPEVLVKCEPEIQIMECDPPSASAKAPVASAELGVDPTTNCIAAAHGSSRCGGEMLNLNKLTTYLDLMTKRTTRDSGSAAMERAIIKSRLRIPFWKADEAVSFICESHRHDIVNLAPMTHCSLCNKKRAKKQTSPQALMMTITFRMSLENYTTTGNILPIGLLVCGNCKDKHLKGVDFSNSQIYQPDSTSSTSVDGKNPTDSNSKPPTAASLVASLPATSGVSITTVTTGPSPTKSDAKRPRVSPPANINPGGGVSILKAIKPNSPVTLQALPRGGESPVKVIPVAAASPSPSPSPSSAPSASSSDNIFARIGRLNDALRAINPRYKPIGFSITSIESCSPSVLDDAVAATETAVSTLMSVIAPGQEAFLWEAIKPKLDSKFSKEGEKDPAADVGPLSSSGAAPPSFEWTVPEKKSKGKECNELT